MIIDSLLNTDLYKLTMERVYFSRFNSMWARFEFKCRNAEITWVQKHLDRINEELDHLCTLQFKEDEIQYLKGIRFLGCDLGFIEFLRLFKLNRSYIHAELKNGELIIWAEGPLIIVSMFEIYTLSIVNETYFDSIHDGDLLSGSFTEGWNRLDKKTSLINKHPFNLVEFGTRRRRSFKWQRDVIQHLIGRIPRQYFNSTSNVLLAKEFDLVAGGTMAHEYLELGQALDEVTVAYGQRHMLDVWADVYQGDLGTALTDNLGVDYFLKHDFQKKHSLLYTGVRHDSGDPYKWGDKIIEHYKSFGIDPTTKIAMFSDSLDFQKAIDLHDYFDGRIKTAFGIGTNLTNDIGLTPLNIVMKMISANGKPVAKLSDSEGKLMCKDERYIKYLKETINTFLQTA